MGLINAHKTQTIKLGILFKSCLLWVHFQMKMSTPPETKTWFSSVQTRFDLFFVRCWRVNSTKVKVQFLEEKNQTEPILTQWFLLCQLSVLPGFVILLMRRESLTFDVYAAAIRLQSLWLRSDRVLFTRHTAQENVAFYLSRWIKNQNLVPVVHMPDLYVALFHPCSSSEEWQ